MTTATTVRMTINLRNLSKTKLVDAVGRQHYSPKKFCCDGRCSGKCRLAMKLNAATNSNSNLVILVIGFSLLCLQILFKQSLYRLLLSEKYLPVQMREKMTCKQRIVHGTLDL